MSISFLKKKKKEKKIMTKKKKNTYKYWINNINKLRKELRF